MTDATRSRLALALVAVTVVFVVAQAVVTIGSAGETEAPGLAALIAGQAGVLLWACIGALIVIKTGNRTGWVFLAIGVLAAMGLFGEEYVGASHRESAEPSLPLTAWAGVAFNAGNSFAAMLLPLVFLLFPTGHPPTPRWRWVVWLWALGAGLAGPRLALRSGDVGGCLDPAECDVVFSLQNPLGLPILDPLLSVLLNVGTAALLLSAILGIASLFVRFRRAGGLERQQLKWMLLVGILIAAIFIAMMVLQSVLPADFDPDDLEWMWIVFVLLIVAGLPVAAAFAILRYRLYDIDVVISKTLVYAGLALLIGSAYVAIVVGIGAAIGAGTDSAALQIAATALIALAFDPARSRLRRWANRVVYGARATPYEVMASFGSRVAGVPSADEVLGDMAEAARAGVGALTATVSVVVDGGARSVTRPNDAHVDGRPYSAGITYAGEPIGELIVVKPQNEPLRPTERGLLDDLASHAGLAIHNVRLGAELESRAQQLSSQTDELRLSRERIVAARDTQRHRLERELRNGVGTELEAIRREIEADARSVVDDPQRVIASLDGLGERANAALEELRDVARGVFPPLLVDQGLTAAVESHVRKLGIDATIRIDPSVGDTRFDPATENAVYFCCIQALQNVVRHAAGARVELRLGLDRRDLVFIVRDDGGGFDPVVTADGEGMQIMRDRIAALGGSLSVDSEPGRGTTVTGRVGAGRLEPTA